MNDVEDLLSDTADGFEDLLRQRPATAAELKALLSNGQRPQCVRVLQEMPDATLLLVVSASP